LVPQLVVGRGMVWQLFSYMFLHVGLWHLLINMLMLWFFGSSLEKIWGTKQFVSYYFFTGVGAGLCSIIVSFNSSVPVVGASGAVFGILVAYAMLFPEQGVLFFFIFPMKMKHAVLILAGINILGALSSPYSGVAYMAHLGGGLCGYLYFKQEWIRFRLFHLVARSQQGKTQRKGNKKNVEKKTENERIDSILDKISQYGIDSLTDREKTILNEKSKEDI
jgi:membrane associated rhomboid family serine protease